MEDKLLLPLAGGGLVSVLLTGFVFPVFLEWYDLWAVIVAVVCAAILSALFRTEGQPGCLVLGLSLIGAILAQIAIGMFA